MLKKTFRYLFFVLLLAFSLEAKKESYDQAVSLGYDCQVAWQLEHNGFRTLAYPLDWVQTPFHSLLFFISNRGANFFDGDKLNVVGPYPGDPAHLHVVDLTYGIASYHDFSLGFENYATVKAKYDRRVQRFFELLNSNKKVLFVRQGFSKEEIEYLDYILNLSYPNLSYTILALADREEYHIDWQLKRVKNFYMPQIPNDWMGNYTRWTEVLSHFSMTPSQQPRSPEEVW